MLARTLRFVMTAGYRAKRLIERFTGHRPFGVHGVVLASGGEVVLVRLTYAPGWQLPGGGRKRGESAREGLLRELREEIGLRGWGSVEELRDWRRGERGQPGHGALFVVRGAVCQPRWSLEIAEARAFAHADLPVDVTTWTRAALERVLF